MRRQIGRCFRVADIRSDRLRQHSLNALPSLYPVLDRGRGYIHGRNADQADSGPVFFLQHPDISLQPVRIHLVLTDKFYAYRDLFANYEKTVMDRVEERLPREDVECFDRILQIMSAELMPECSK